MTQPLVWPRNKAELPVRRWPGKSDTATV